MDSQIASRNAGNSVIVPTIKASFLSTYHRQQSWLLPDTLIYYITKYPLSAKIYQKLIQTCKHFFIKNQIIVAQSLMSNLISSTSGFVIKNDEKEIKIRNISTNIWITDLFALSPRHPISEFIPKIYRCDTKVLDLWDQRIFFNEFFFLASKCEKLYFHGSTVLNKNGTVVTLEKLFVVVENIKVFCCYFFDDDVIKITSKTFKELIQIPHFSSLDVFSWARIPEVFDIECLYDYIKKNTKILFDLHFRETISEAYSNRLQTIVNEILADENRKFRVPFIYFPGIDQTSCTKLGELQKAETQK